MQNNQIFFILINSTLVHTQRENYNFNFHPLFHFQILPVVTTKPADLNMSVILFESVFPFIIQKKIQVKVELEYDFLGYEFT